MRRKRFTSEQLISKLREGEVELTKGKTIALVCKQIGVTEQTYYRWRKEYSGLKVERAKVLIERWRREYNQVRPHCSLNYRAPASEIWLSGTEAQETNAWSKENMLPALT